MSLSCQSGGAQNSGLDGAQMLADVQFLSHDSLEGRRVGSEGNRMAREYIARSFAAAGVETVEDSYFVPTTIERRGDTLEAVNVVGMVPGTVRDGGIMVISAHYDHLGVRDSQVMNGADDNASGTAAVMALAKYFVEHPANNTIFFILFDAEEGGLSGSRGWVRDFGNEIDAITMNVNLDMVSHADSTFYVVGTHQYPNLKPYVEAVTPHAPVVLKFGHDSPEWTGSDNWTNASDHAAFHEVGVPFLYFGVEDHPDYHAPTDDFETINPEFYVAAIETVLDVILELDMNLGSIQAASPAN